MNVQVKSFKHEHGYTEWKDITRYLGTLEHGFDYYYKDKYYEMEPTKKLEFCRQGRTIIGHFRGWMRRPKKFKGRVHKILWPSCNTPKPIVFFIDNTLYYE